MKKRSRALEWIASLLETCGFLTVTYGVGLMYRPLGWVLFGVLLAVWGWALTPKGQDALAKERGLEHR